MKTLDKASVAVVIFALAFFLAGSVNAATQVDLGTAGSFAVLGGSTVTNTGSSVISGDLGVSPGLAVTGFPPGTVSGIIHAGDATAGQAESDLTAAYLDAAGQSCDEDLTGQDLGGMTLTPGTYCFETSAQLTGTLELDAQGDSDAVFIFQIGSTLTTASGSGVSTINEAQGCHVFWQIGSSATLGTDTQFKGNILALTSITADTGANVYGRLLARNGAVTLDDNDVERATCSGSNNGDEDEDRKDVDIKVTKKADPATLSSGPGSVTYTYKVTNEGNVSLKNISVKDDKCSPTKYISGDGDHDSKLDENERWLYTCTKVVSKTETNKVTAKGTNGKEVSDTDTAKVVVSVPGLPNAGVGADDTGSASWIMAILTGILTVSILVGVIRKKQTA